MATIELNDEEKVMVKEARWIDAIKSIRRRFNLDLVTAKRVVDAYRGHGGTPIYGDDRQVLIQIPTRDLLAGLALQGLLAREREDGSGSYLLTGINGDANRKEIAKDAVSLADTLIEALRGNP